jgi:ribosome-associated translation inhibitor RaiA
MTPIIPQLDIFSKNLNISNPNKALVENQIKENQTFFLNRQKSTIHLKENKIQNEDEKGKFNDNITKTINGNEIKIVLRSPPNKNPIGNKENKDKIKDQNQNGNEMKGETKVVLEKFGHKDCWFNDNSKSNVENSVTKIAISSINNHFFL